jgi:hypothetical protein
LEQQRSRALPGKSASETPKRSSVSGGSRDRSWGRHGNDELERARTENRELVQRLREQADELLELKQERDSLLLTIQLLQDDLASSERQRARMTPT